MVEMCFKISMNIIVVVRLLHKYFYEKKNIHTSLKKDFTPSIWRNSKVDKRAAGHSTKHEIPVLISADAKMVDTKFVCTASTCIYLCKT